MTQASEVIAQQYAAAGINKITWGSIGVNVKEFGAVGDGVTDDTQAFNRAMASITGEGTLLLPPGTYRIASSMTIPSTICTYFTNGGMIAPGSGATVTINGEIIAELTQIFAGLGTVAGSFKVPCVYPQWWGAKGDGVTDDTTAIQKAISIGSGTVFFPKGNYFTSGVLSIPSGVKLLANGGITDGNTTAQILANGGAVFYITNTVTPFISLWGQNITIDGFTFYYPNQVDVTSSTPTVYPFTIKNNAGPGIVLKNLTFINAYEAISLADAASGRCYIDNINLGCLKTGISIDNALDVVRISNIQMSPFYSVGNTFPTALDTWCMQNGTGITIGRADEMIMDNIFIFAKRLGIGLRESTNLAFSPVLGGYGVMSNITFDFVDIGISCKNTNVFGWDISNIHVSPNFGSGSLRSAIVTTAGGTMPPRLRFQGGSFWGGTGGTQALNYVSHNAGYLYFDGIEFNNNVSNSYFSCAASTNLSVVNCDFLSGGTVGVFGVLNTMSSLSIVNNRLNGNTSNLFPGTNIPANASVRDNDFKFGVVTPTLPTSTTVYTNNLGIPVRVFVSGGTVSAISVKGVTTGLISGSFILDPQDSITLTYTVAPTWVWLGF